MVYEEGFGRVEGRRRRREGSKSRRRVEMRSRVEVAIFSFDFTVERWENCVRRRKSEL